MKTFLHILLTIGKIVLIVLLVIVCLIAALLFIPFGYRARVRKDAETLDVRGRISWLFIVLRADVRYVDKEVNYEVRFFGIPLLRVIQWIKARRANAANTKKKQDAPPAPKRVSKKPTAAPGRVSEETFRGTGPERDHASSHDTDQAETPAQNDDQKEKADAQNDEREKKADAQNDEREEKGGSFFARAKESLRAIVARISLIWDKVREGYLMIKSPSFRRAVSQLKKRIIKILKHVRPRKIRGTLRFGFEDPSNTGKLLAALSWIYPSIPRGLDLEPVFTDKTLDADVDVRGHIILFVLLVQAVALFADQDVRKLFRGVMKKGSR